MSAHFLPSIHFINLPSLSFAHTGEKDNCVDRIEHRDLWLNAKFLLFLLNVMVWRLIIFIRAVLLVSLYGK